MMRRMMIWMDIRIRVSIRFRMMMMVKVGLDDIRRRPYFPRWMPVIRPSSCLGCQGLRGQRGPVTNLKTILKTLNKTPLKAETLYPVAVSEGAVLPL